MKQILIVFDFDWSFVNENTDTYIIEQLTPKLVPLVRKLRKEGCQWTRLMHDTVQKMMLEENVTRLQIEEYVSISSYY